MNHQAALLNQAEICLRILTHAANFEKSSVASDRPGNRLIASAKFPTFTQMQLKSIASDLERGMKLRSVLLNHSFCFSFYPNHLDELLSQTKQNNLKFTAIYVLLTYLAWHIAYDDMTIIDASFTHLISALATISHSSNYSAFPQLRIIAISAFKILFSSAMKYVQEDDFSGLLSPLYLFFGQNTDLPAACFDMVVTSADWIMKKSEVIIIAHASSFFSFASSLPLPQTHAIQMLTMIVNSMNSQITNIFTLFPKYIPLIKPEIAESYFSTIPTALIKYIESIPIVNEFIPAEYNPDKLVNLQEANSVEVVLRFQSDNTFPNGIEILRNVEFPPIKKLSKMIDPFLKTRLDALIKGALINENFQKTMLATFLTSIHEETSNSHVFDLFAIFFYSTKKLHPNVLDVPFELIFCDILFDPSITVFDNDQRCFEFLNPFRNYAVEFLLSINQDFIEDIFASIMSFPLLFTEKLYRFITNSSLLPTNEESIQIMNKALMSASLFYQNCPQHNIREVEIVRTGIFYFLSQLFLIDTKYLIIFFDDDSNCYSFLSFVFEPPLRECILDLFLTYLTKQQTAFNENIPVIIIGILNIASASFPEERAYQLVNGFLTTINAAFVHRRNLNTQFEPLVCSIFRLMQSLDQSALSSQTLDLSLQFLALVSNVYMLKRDDLELIEIAIKKVQASTTSERIFDRFVQLLAADFLPSLNPSFHVRQPKVLKTFLNVFVSTPRITDVLHFIEELCVFSSSNSIACNKSDIDIWLLDFIQEHPEYTQPALSLLTRIAYHVSSVSVVLRLISMLRPVKGKYVTTQHSLIINAINSIFCASKKMPSSSIPLTNEYQFSINGLISNQVESSFVATFWIFHDSSMIKYKPQLFALTETNEKSIRVNIYADQFHIFHQTDEFKTVANLDLKIPIKEWALIAIKYENNPEEPDAYIKISIDCQKWEIMDVPHMKWKNRTAVSCVIGGTTPDNLESPEFPSEFGQFGFFYELSDEELSLMYENGPAAAFHPHNNNIFYYQPIIENGDYGFKQMHKNDDFTLIPFLTQTTLAVPFVDVVIHSCKIELFLPLFLQISMTNENGEYIGHYSDQILDLLGNILSASEEGQMSFAESNGFGIMSHLLEKMPHEYLNYSLYFRFFTMLESVTYPPLQQQLFHWILMSVDLWFDCDPDSHLRIARHWARVVFPSYTNLITNSFTFARILTEMRLFYYYSDCDSIQIVKRRPIALNVKECRQCLFSICGSLKLNSQSFLSFIGHIITIPDVQQVIELLNFLIGMARNQPNSFLNLGSSLEAVTLLYHLFVFNNDKITALVFKAIFALHRQNIFKSVTLPEHIDIILHQLTFSFIRISNFMRLCKLLNKKGYFDLLPICVWMAINLHSKDQEWFINSLTPDHRFCTHQMWAFWPITLAVRISDVMLQDKLLKFIAYSDSTWISTYTVFDIVSQSNEVEIEDLKCRYLTIICTYILDDIGQIKIEQINSYLRILRRHLFWRNSDDSNSALHEEFSKSPFTNAAIPKRKLSIGCRPLEIGRSCSSSFFQRRRASLIDGKYPTNSGPKRSNSCHLPYQFTNKVYQFDNQKVCIKFGLRISNEGNWLDADLARLALQLFNVCNLSQFLKYDLIICSFLISKFTDEVITHLNEIRVSQKEITVYNDLIQYLMLRANKELPFNIQREEDIKVFKSYTKFLYEHCIDVIENRNRYPYNNFFKTTSEKGERMFALMEDKTLIAAGSAAEKLLEAIEATRKLNAKSWLRLWRCMTIDLAPWAPEQSTKTSTLKRDSTLCTLFPPKVRQNFEDSTFVGNTFILNNDKKFNQKNKIYFEAPCDIITINAKIPSSFAIHSQFLRIRKYDGDLEDIDYNTIHAILHRTFYSQPTGIEIFSRNGKAMLLRFPDLNSFNILKQIKDKAPTSSKIIIQTTPYAEFFSALHYTNDWIDKKISNFDYLMLLNRYSGRSFNDINQYPILPWIISDYKSAELDTTDPTVFRDLHKTMISIGEERLNRLITQNTLALDKYLITPQNVIESLESLEPFSSMQCEEHITSISEMYNKATTDDNDYRELVPEFFFLPEIIDSKIELPPWAENPLEFIYQQRKALESEFVSNSINSWFDLIWGVKQRGSNAELSFNIYQENLYAERNQQIMETSEVMQIQQLQEKYGVVPFRLFNSPHPRVLPKNEDTCKFDRKIIVQTQSHNLLFAAIRFISSYVYSIFYIDRNGDVIADKFNFFQLEEQAQCTNVNSGKVQLNVSSSFIFPDRRNELHRSFTTKSGIVQTIASSSNSNLSALDVAGSLKAVVINAKSAIRKQISNFSDLDFTFVPKLNNFSILGKSVAVVDGHKNFISLIDMKTGTKAKFPAHHSGVLCIHSDGEYFVAAGKDAVVNLYSVSDLTRTIFSIPLYRDQIVCCAVSSKYKLIASGTKDGYLVLSSISRGSTVKVIDLEGCRPYLMLVTKAWGFIVIAATKLDAGKVVHLLSVFNVNGQFIRSQLLSHAITAWDTWRDEHAFDHVIMANEIGRIFSFEAFYLDTKELSARSPKPVITLHYSKCDHGVIIVSNDGCIVFAPI